MLAFNSMLRVRSINHNLNASASPLVTYYGGTSSVASPGFCVHEGKRFYSGEEVVLPNCQDKCQCMVNEGYSFFMCEPLCERYYDVSRCADGGKPVMEMEDTSVPECKCPRYSCPEPSLSVAHFINYGIDDNELFEPDLYENSETYYVE
ncbi:hypothetical protein OS493_030737 [Desmophyllum pertusum]|uniref:Uncharacterized protein n=1 Tax=Desmophyllum pertusum TaxID=174260 RepID=A0A9X0CV38_9CNID|nr:hypothetical protein OS493_030737 [Desmophyllum pertusum]